MTGLPSASQAKRLDFSIVCVVATLVAIGAALAGLNIDQAIFYRQGLKHIAGQRIYEDFYLPFGPICGVLFALLLKLTPTGGYAYILASVITNAAAALCIWWLVLRSTQSRWAAMFAAILTACWFQTQLGGYYNDHLSYLFVLFAAVLLLSSCNFPAKYLAIGALLSLAPFTKQTTGGLSVVCFLCCLPLVHNDLELSKKSYVQILIGGLLATAIMLSLIAIFGSLSGFIQQVLVLPSYFTAVEPSKASSKYLTNFFIPFHIYLKRVFLERKLGQASFYPVVLLVYFCYFTFLVKYKFFSANRKCAFLILFFLSSTLLSGATIGRLYTHATFGVWAAAAIALVAWSRRAKTVQLFTVFCLFISIALVQFFHNKRIFAENYIQSYSDLWPIRLSAEPSFARDKLAGLNAQRQLVEFLKSDGRKYALVDERLYLVPMMLGRESTYPIIFYHPSLTLPRNPQLLREAQSGTTEILEQTPLIVGNCNLDPGSPAYQYRSIAAQPQLADYCLRNYRSILHTRYGVIYERTE